MEFMSQQERSFAEAVARLVYCNPFLPERIVHEREALGSDYIDSDIVWHKVDRQGHPNVEKINHRAQALVDKLAARQREGATVKPNEKRAYEDLAVYLLYNRYQRAFLDYIREPEKGTGPVPFYKSFREDAIRYLGPPGNLPPHFDPAHLFACSYQIRRAFHYIFAHIIGGSMPAARLRARVWQSIFTHDLRRYRRALYNRMGDIATLITGPSGTGKELVANAIGLSQYIPFSPAGQNFACRAEASFFPLNLTALSPTLIESELFGHRRGAFTGALTDRTGWLELCQASGSVFLDEVGDVDASIQVKLLRVLQNRVFQRLGETRDRVFRGKFIAATNRELDQEMASGKFREDFYYRLCSDIIVTPSLAEQLADMPGALDDLIHYITVKVAGASEAPALVKQVKSHVGQHFTKYNWPGNVRELEQCVRNIMIHGEYHPRVTKPGRKKDLSGIFATGELTGEELLREYVTHIYHLTGSYQETARRLQMDRRTVKSKVDPDLLEQLQTKG